jgi:hypothetical protein
MINRTPPFSDFAPAAAFTPRIATRNLFYLGTFRCAGESHDDPEHALAETSFPRAVSGGLRGTPIASNPAPETSAPGGLSRSKYPKLKSL